MIFQHTWEWIVDKSPYTGEPKTQTCRLKKPNEWLEETWPSGKRIVQKTKSGKKRTKLEDLGVYSIQPGRGQKGVGHFICDHISEVDVRTQPEEFYQREGFANGRDFLELWERMHGHNYQAWCIQMVYLPTRAK